MKAADLGTWIPRFFQEYLVRQRGVSTATIESYRDTFRFLLKHLRTGPRSATSSLPISILTSGKVISFLDFLEHERGNQVRTRNVRLAAIRSFVRYLVDWLGPEVPDQTRKILGIPFKQHVRPIIGYLRGEEIESLLAITGSDWTGRRNHLLVLMLYNTGARVSELVNVRVRDLLSSECKQIEILGKGRKRRTLPLWRRTRTEVRQWIKANRLHADDPLLPNRWRKPMTRSGVAKQIQEMVAQAARSCPNLRRKSISPHTFRHSLAMRMLESGVAIEVIALWLGHESTITTHGYVEASLAMKRQALDRVQSPNVRRKTFHPSDALLSFLQNL